MTTDVYSDMVNTGEFDINFQVATTCFSCSPPDLNLVITNFMFCIHVT